MIILGSYYREDSIKYIEPFSVKSNGVVSEGICICVQTTEIACEIKRRDCEYAQAREIAKTFDDVMRSK